MKRLETSSLASSFGLGLVEAFLLGELAVAIFLRRVGIPLPFSLSGFPDPIPCATFRFIHPRFPDDRLHLFI